MSDIFLVYPLHIISSFMTPLASNQDFILKLESPNLPSGPMDVFPYLGSLCTSLKLQFYRVFLSYSQSCRYKLWKCQNNCSWFILNFVIWPSLELTVWKTYPQQCQTPLLYIRIWITSFINILHTLLKSLVVFITTILSDNLSRINPDTVVSTTSQQCCTSRWTFIPIP